MNDPWDVKSVRQFGQYVSCMKINGVPLLPPVLSLECRKEMQYYKLLAKEIEKRILHLQIYAHESDDSDSSEQQIAAELVGNENLCELSSDKLNTGFDVNIDKITAITTDKKLDSEINSVALHNTKPTNIIESPKFIIDLSVTINEEGRNVLESALQQTDVPEHDYDSPKNNTNNSLGIKIADVTENVNEDIINFSFKLTDKDVFTESKMSKDIDIIPDEEYLSLSSISSKTFTGSLNNLHKESKPATLIRQRSYTVLNPSPQLLAHLENQAHNRGVDIDTISMSESQCHLSTPCKKRRSWDLESAKEKWSSMALELNHNKNISHKLLVKSNNASKQLVTKIVNKSPCKAKPENNNLSENLTDCKRICTPKSPPKVLPYNKTTANRQNPVESPKNKHFNENRTHNALISEQEDPASKIKNLYERIQQQQLKQMASLVEKQRREQMLLQQVFDEQNKVLYNQLKIITPKPNDVKEVWQDNVRNPVPNSDNSSKDRGGPVSLSQLINQNQIDLTRSPLVDTNNYISHCDSVLKKSKEITSHLKSQRAQSLSQKETAASPNNRMQIDPSTRTNSPVRSSTVSRRLKYEGSLPSEQDNEPILTDRTNDTLADLNVTFPSDQSDDYRPYDQSMLSQIGRQQRTPNYDPVLYTDVAIANMEETIHKSMEGMRVKRKFSKPTEQELAAATKIVAYAKGFLVRRLMKTERVQGIVQTIKDALLCALQLHQDREGIRGADVDLHRRLIQQITAACYSLHETFVACSPAERCAVLAADRARRRSALYRQAHAQAHPRSPANVMSQSFSGSLAARTRRASTSLMTQSNYETYSGDKCVSASMRARHVRSPRRRPWR